MPWTPEDAPKFTHKANTDAKKQEWAEIANRALSNGMSDSSAIRIANAAMTETHKDRGRHRVI
ncbi:MAG TPA: hypothetical protein VIY48_01835 [Candidatus Paceibacterota bacterium]